MFLSHQSLCKRWSNNLILKLCQNLKSNIRVYTYFYKIIFTRTLSPKIMRYLKVIFTRLSCFNVKTMLLSVKTSYFKLSKIILVRLVRLDWIGWFSYVRLFRLAQQVQFSWVSQVSYVRLVRLGQVRLGQVSQVGLVSVSAKFKLPSMSRSG